MNFCLLIKILVKTRAINCNEKLLDRAKKSKTDLIKTASKRAIRNSTRN